MLLLATSPLHLHNALFACHRTPALLKSCVPHALRQAVYVEAISNPTLVVADLPRLAEVAHTHVSHFQANSQHDSVDIAFNLQVMERWQGAEPTGCID